MPVPQPNVGQERAGGGNRTRSSWVEARCAATSTSPAGQSNLEWMAGLEPASARRQRAALSVELHPHRWTPRRDSHPCGTVARPLCRRPPSATRPLGVGCGGGTRTPDLPVNGRSLCQLRYSARSAAPRPPRSGEPRPAGSGLVPPAGVGPAISWVKARRVAVPPRRRGWCRRHGSNVRPAA